MERNIPNLGIVLTFLRQVNGYSTADLAKAAGIPYNLLNDYERGRKPLKRERLEHLVAFMGLRPPNVESVLECLAANKAGASGDATSRVRRSIEEVASQAARLAGDFTRTVMKLMTESTEILAARQEAEELWARLKRRTGPQRRVLVEDGSDYWSWALCERIAAESVATAANAPREALELAHLSVRIAERIPGEEAWRSRLQGYAWAPVSNAQRACNRLPDAEKSIAHSRQLWEKGAGARPGWLNEGFVPWLEAVLRRDQGRLAEARERSDEALALDNGELRSKILLSKAIILKFLDDPEGSTAVLEEAAPMIDARREPRLALGLRFNLVGDLCELGRAKEAEVRIAEVRELAERLGEELDLVRVVWLEGKLAAASGRPTEAEAAFTQVRRRFMASELAYDYALSSL